MSLTITNRMRGKMNFDDSPYKLFSLNTNPVENPFCQKMHKNPKTICSKCYSWASTEGYCSICVPAWDRNAAELSSDIIPMNKVYKSRNADYFRFNAHGELWNDIHFINLMNISKKNPGVQFALWTKRFKIVQKHIAEKPGNVFLVYSNPFVNTFGKLPEHFDKVFNVFEKDFAEAHGVDMNCKKKCSTCILCYTRNKVKVINEKLK